MNAVESEAELAARFDALGRFLRVVSPHLTAASAPVAPDAVPSAQHLVDRARARLELGAQGHTVVALAGATGSGKSSLFNALARMELSPPGPLRPTTDQAYACVWGDGDAEPLLDWLRVEPARRFRRESPLDAEDEAALRGVVLLDLPDLDSVATGHRVEASRLVGVVDLVIWVLDPQKYADASVHDGYLRHMAALRDVTVVVFNQTDRLSPSDVDRCVADLRRLLDADGLPGVTVVGASAATGTGVGEIRTLLERTVASRSPAVARLSGELDQAIAALSRLVAVTTPGSGVPVEAGDELRREAVDELADEFADASGVSAVVAEAGQEYRGRTALPGWPFRRRPGRRSGNGDPPPADPAAVAHAMRRFAAVSSAGLPAPWPDEVRAAATAGADRLPDELGRAVRDARPRRPRAIGWRLVRLVWWLSVASVVLGAGWLVWHALHVRIGGVSASGWPTLRRVPLAVLLIVAGAVLAVALPPLGRWLAAVRAKRWRRTAERRLGGSTATVAREAVAPVRAVLRDYAEARSAFADARRA
jgi:GTP-binding protein EngB required for normal cell division